MEDPSSFHAVSAHWIPTSFSATSLDVGQVTRAASGLRSLMSESVTLDSLSSRSSDGLPAAFPPLKLRPISPMALGDDLKMFSAVVPKSEENSGFRIKSSVILAAPTSPRLKSMFKECLSINQWAEHSTAFYPPGHVPWDCISNEMTLRWVPEGSLFSPESFSRALSKARTWNDGGPVHPTVPTILKCPGKQASRAAATPLLQPKRESLDPELLDMVRELNGLRSFFQDAPVDGMDSDSAALLRTIEAVPLPSLVISNSQFTIPVALESSVESSQSISKHDPTTLAYRRGKKTPSPLTLQTTATVAPAPMSYPGIPTPFLGSPAIVSPGLTPNELGDGGEKTPGMRVEDMITNLRLKCSTMALHTPPIDESWNSRSIRDGMSKPVPPEQRKSPQQEDEDEWAFAKSMLDGFSDEDEIEEEAALLPPPQPTLKPAASRLQSRSPSPSGIQRPCKSTHIFSPIKAIERKLSKPSIRPEPRPLGPKDIKSKPAISSPKPLRSAVNSTPPLRSAMLKDVEPKQKTPAKNVRFALKPSELEKARIQEEVLVVDNKASPKTPRHSVDQPRKSLLTRKPTAHISPSNIKLPQPLAPRPAPIAPRVPPTTSKGPIAAKDLATSRRSTPVQPKPRVQSMAAARSPLRQSFVSNAVAPAVEPMIEAKVEAKIEVDDRKEVATPAPPVRRANTLGRHSLSRIIKGPMFNLNKENKRATISIGTAIEVRSDENAMRRGESPEVSTVKKSRMSVPLRNIFRFK